MREAGVVLAEQAGEQAGVVFTGQRRVQGVRGEDLVGAAGFEHLGYGDIEPGGQLAVIGSAAELAGEVFLGGFGAAAVLPHEGRDQPGVPTDQDLAGPVPLRAARRQRPQLRQQCIIGP